MCATAPSPFHKKYITGSENAFYQLDCCAPESTFIAVEDIFFGKSNNLGFITEFVFTELILKILHWIYEIAIHS
jgi:hypothetical protein